MPKYNYICHTCANRFEVRLSYAEVDTARPICPDCGSADCERGLSRINFITESGGNGHSHSSGGCSGCAGGSCSTCAH